jgi:hypothetical protein
MSADDLSLKETIPLSKKYAVGMQSIFCSHVLLFGLFKSTRFVPDIDDIVFSMSKGKKPDLQIYHFYHPG